MCDVHFLEQSTQRGAHAGVNASAQCLSPNIQDTFENEVFGRPWEPPRFELPRLGAEARVVELHRFSERLQCRDDVRCPGRPRLVGVGGS